jgi:hypothetical protein
MLQNCNGNGRAVECTECDPPRRFKNKAGLNGHRQFKHGRLPDSRDALPNGNQSQMYQDLTDRVNQVIDRQDEMFDHFKNGANGNENEEVGDFTSSEGNDYSNELIGILSPPPVDPTTYSHQDCGAPLVRMQRHCGGCGQKIDWNGLP